MKRFRELDFTGPLSGVGDHPQYMAHKDGRVVKLPNPHGKRADIGEVLLKKILAEAHISVNQWLGEPDD